MGTCRPRNTFADILEAMRSKAPRVDDPKYKSECALFKFERKGEVTSLTGRIMSKRSNPRKETQTSLRLLRIYVPTLQQNLLSWMGSTTSTRRLPSGKKTPADLHVRRKLNDPVSYDDDLGDSELLTRIREAFSDNSEPNPAAPKTPERRRRSSSCAPNTPSPAKRNIEEDEPNPDQSSFAIPKEEDLAAMFYGNPWFAFKKRNPKQVFLWDSNVTCVPFKVVKGGKVLGEWVFALDMVYEKDALHQLLMATSFHGNDPGNKMIDILRKFDRQPEVVYKKTFVTRDKAFQFTVKELWCDEEWKFNLGAKVTFSRLHSMMKTSRRVEMESELWPDWLDYSEKK